MKEKTNIISIQCPALLDYMECVRKVCETNEVNYDIYTETEMLTPLHQPVKNGPYKIKDLDHFIHWTDGILSKCIYIGHEP